MKYEGRSGEIDCVISWGEDTLRRRSKHGSPSPTQSNPIKVNQTESNQIKPVSGKYLWHK